MHTESTKGGKWGWPIVAQPKNLSQGPPEELIQLCVFKAGLPTQAAAPGTRHQGLCQLLCSNYVNEYASPQYNINLNANSLMTCPTMTCPASLPHPKALP